MKDNNIGTYKSKSISVKNIKEINKPNEDYFLCDDNNGVYIIVDGVSRDKINGIYPNPSPAAAVSKIFVETSYKYFQENRKIGNTEELLYNMFKSGNKQIEIYNKQKRWENDFYPGTVGIIVIIRDEKIYFAYIGDCYGFIINKKKNIFTKCQTENIAKNKGKFSSYEIRNEICNNKEHPCAYGVINGDLRALDFIEIGIINLAKEDKIFLCTDGFVDALVSIPPLDIIKMSFNEILLHSEETDDKTLIVIEGE